MNIRKLNCSSSLFFIKNIVVCYSVVFFCAPSFLTLIFSSLEKDSDLIECQGEDDSAEEDCFDDYSELQFNAFMADNKLLERAFLCNYIFKEHLVYAPDIFIQPPRSSSS